MGFEIPNQYRPNRGSVKPGDETLVFYEVWWS